MTVSELAERYIEAMDASLIMGKGGRPKRPSTIYVNTLELVRRVSNIYGVAVEELGAFFGFIRQPGEREVWVDVFRSPNNQHLVRDTMNAGQRRAYGTMLAMLEVV